MGIGDGETGAADSGRKHGGDIGMTSDAGNRGPAMTSMGTAAGGAWGNDAAGNRAGVMGAGDGDLAETAGVTGAAGDRGASSAARDSKRAGAGG